MDRSYPHFANCAPPGVAHLFLTPTNFLGVVLIAIIGGGTLAGVASAILAAIFNGSITIGCVSITGLIWATILFINMYDTWFYNGRLMCIREKQCAIGSMVGSPFYGDAPADGDQNYELLLAPFVMQDIEPLFREVIDERPELGPGPTDPSSDALGLYIANNLSERERNILYVRVLREKMLTQANSDYQQKYYIRIESEMGADAFANTDDDTIPAADPTPDPTPMFTMNPTWKLAPYFLNEIEGDQLHRWLMNIVAGLWTALVAATAACVICEAYGLGPVLCSFITAAIAFLAWLLAYKIADAFNDPEDGQASQTDVGFTDPEFDGDQPTIGVGDVILVYGDWIMDPSHGQHFELHPVRAIYMLCRDPGNPDRWEVLNDLTGFPRNECPFPGEEDITEDVYAEMCDFVERSEEADRSSVERLLVDRKTALSVAAGLR